MTIALPFRVEFVIQRTESDADAEVEWGDYEGRLEAYADARKRIVEFWEREDAQFWEYRIIQRVILEQVVS